MICTKIVDALSYLFSPDLFFILRLFSCLCNRESIKKYVENLRAADVIAFKN